MFASHAHSENPRRHRLHPISHSVALPWLYSNKRHHRQLVVPVLNIHPSRSSISTTHPYLSCRSFNGVYSSPPVSIITARRAVGTTFIGARIRSMGQLHACQHVYSAPNDPRAWFGLTRKSSTTQRPGEPLRRHSIRRRRGGCSVARGGLGKHCDKAVQASRQSRNSNGTAMLDEDIERKHIRSSD